MDAEGEAGGCWTSVFQSVADADGASDVGAVMMDHGRVGDDDDDDVTVKWRICCNCCWCCYCGFRRYFRQRVGWNEVCSRWSRRGVVDGVAD